MYEREGKREKRESEKEREKKKRESENDREKKKRERDRVRKRERRENSLNLTEADDGQRLPQSIRFINSAQLKVIACIVRC